MIVSAADIRIIGHWLCPPPPGELPIWRDAMGRIAPRVQALRSPQSLAPGNFGIELRTAYLAIERVRQIPVADNDFWQTKARVLFTRPALEPIALSFEHRYRAGTLGRDEMRRTVSMLAAGDLQIRTTRAAGRSRHGDILYEPPDVARQWLASFPRVLRGMTEVPEFPVYVYAKAIMAHPFTDANGRFARLMFAAALAAHLNLAGNCLAFAPSFYRFAEQLSASLTTLSNSGDWQPLTRKLIGIVDDAILLTEMATASDARGAPGGENRFGNPRRRL